MQLFLAFVVALSITAALIPVLAHWAPSIGLTDAPGPRKVHAAPVPRVGGLAMAAGLFIATLLTVEWSPPVRGLLTGLLVLVLFGLWDDRVNLGYVAKFAGQVVAVAICMLAGAPDFRRRDLPGAARDIFHHMGTTRMSRTPQSGVTNTNLRCHDVDNLYIAGSSVFPTGGIANPTALARTI